MTNSTSPPFDEIQQIQALLDKQAITEVIYRYCRGIDRMDQELVRSCYSSAAVDQHGSFSGNVDEFITWCWALLEKYQHTFHFIGNILIEWTTEGALCESYGISYHESDNPKAHLNLTTGFRYIDRFVKEGNDWKIIHRQAVTEWSQHIKEENKWQIPKHLAKGQRDQQDPIYQQLPLTPNTPIKRSI